MSFSWSLWFAQSCGEFQLAACEALQGVGILSDRSKPAVFGSQDFARYYLYVDNYGVLGILP
eukprot:2148896-Alexandrium_andersonii.AAC.1